MEFDFFETFDKGEIMFVTTYGFIKAVSVFTVKHIWIRSIRGIEHIPATGPCILIANHSSYMDFLILGTVLEGIVKKQLHFWANLKVVNHPFFRYYVKYFKSIPVDTRNPRPAFWKTSIRLLRDNGYIGIFPEGTRSRTGIIGPFNAGYLRLANATGSPIVPVYLHDVYDILPPHRKFPRFKGADITVHPPICFDNRMSTDELEQVSRQIQAKYYGR